MWASNKVLWRPIRKIISRSMPVLEFGSSGVRGSVLNREEMPLIATTRRPLEEAISEVVKKDG